MNEALQTGLYLTVAGMGLVFLVLAMLWGLIVLLLKLDKEPKLEIPAETNGAVLPESDGVLSLEAVAAIATAVLTYKADRRLGGATNASASSTREDVDYWSMAGRAQQRTDWHPGRRS